MSDASDALGLGAGALGAANAENRSVTPRYQTGPVSGFLGSNGLVNASTARQYLTYIPTGREQAIYATGTTNGASSQLAVYYMADGTTSVQFVGGASNQVYTNQLLTVPANCIRIGISSILTGAGGQPPALQVVQSNGSSFLTDVGSWEAPYQPLTSGFIDGNGAVSASSARQYFWYTIVGDEVDFRASGTLLGTNSQLAIYMAGSTVLGRQAIDTTGSTVTNVVNQRLIVPAETTRIGLSSYVSSGTSIQMPPKLEVRRVRRLGSSVNPLCGKKVLFLGNSVFDGSSIPAGGTIPELIQRGIGAGSFTVGTRNGNEAVSSSMARSGVIGNVSAGTDDYGWTGANWTNVAWSLTKTTAMANDLITNWVSKWHDRLVDESGNPRPATLDATAQAKILATCIDNVLTNYTGANAPDIVVIQHGRNDAYDSMGGPGTTATLNGATISGTTLTFSSATGTVVVGMGLQGLGLTNLLPGTYIVSGSGTTWTVNNNHTTAVSSTTLYASGIATRDTRYFTGALNVIIDKILAINPRAQIWFANHYERSDPRFTQVVPAVEAVADYWGFPRSQTYKLFGASQIPVTYNGSVTTMQRMLAPDGTHPFSDTTGVAQQRYAELEIIQMLGALK